MDKCEETDIRHQIKLFYENLINKKIENLCSKERKNLGEILYYMLVIVEEGFYGPDSSKQKLGQIKRSSIERFIKELLRRGATFKTLKYDHAKYNKYTQYIDEVIELAEMGIIVDSIEKTKGIDVIKVECIGKNEYELIFPEIEDDLDREEIYFNTNEEEIEIKSKPTQYLDALYITPNLSYIKEGSILELKKSYSILNELDKNIDWKFYSLCKESIKCDIKKIGSDFKSEIINSRTELIDILGFIYYLAHINLIKSGLNPVCINKPIEQGFVICYKKEELLRLMSETTRVDIEIVNRYIEYLSFTKECKGRMNEYPLFDTGDYILFIPSSILLNDFQFSIVNGHYDKGIDILDRKDTVSQSVVDKIYNKCCNYKNIAIAENKEYFVKDIKYKGKILKSDVDIALYDKLSNRVLVLECKWKENVFLRYMNYKNTEKAVKRAYTWQLGRHKAFIELDYKNIDLLFDDHEFLKSKPYFPIISYLMLDKRAQYHFDGKHIISEFILSHLIDKYSYGNILRLDLIIDEIESMNTRVKYRKTDIKETVVINENITIHNNKHYVKLSTYSI
ncbi:hypothetical protein [Tepidibacter sp. Z1-5]|uniref:hypothetical protein n=1 Tax=Tepidibacter sp. Z1-5 TaxID=3134138 RepID=UPI0030BE04C6